MRPFDGLLAKVTNSVDQTYSRQKSTYKGWAAFFKEFSGLSRSHSSQLLKLSEHAGDHMGLKLPLTECMKVENPVLKAIIGETLYAVQLLSHLHLNLSERMIELSELCTHQYEQVKRTKEQFMEMLRKSYPESLSKANPRQPTEQQLLRGMFQMMDKLEQDEIGRTQALRQNSIMFYRIYKKIAEKQLEMVTANGARISKMEVESTRTELLKVIKEVNTMYNGYPNANGQRLQRKNEKALAQSIRSSLKMSRVDHSAIAIEKTFNQLQNIDQKYQAEEERVIRPLNEKYLNRRGLFSKDMQHYYELSSQVKATMVGAVAYSMLESFWLGQSDYANSKSSLLSIKVRLRLGDIPAVTQPSRSMKEYIEKEYQRRSKEERRCLSHLMNLSLYHSKQLEEEQLKVRLVDINNPIPAVDFLFDVWVGAVLLDCLLQTLFQSRQGEQFLVPNYHEVFKIIARFGKAFLGLEQQLPLIMFLQRVGRISAYRDESEIEPNIGELEQLMDQTNTENPSNYTDLTVYLWNHLRNVLSTEFMDVYKPNTHPGLMVQIMCWLDKHFQQKSSLEQIMACVRLAGYRYLLGKDPERVMFGMRRDSSDKLKLLSELVRNTQFLLIDQKILVPLAENIGRCYSLAEEGVLKSVRQQFFGYIAEILLLNINTIEPSQLADKDGYILNLGIELCKIDQLNPQNIACYEQYFRVMEVGLKKMESQYKDLLEQTRTTQLWILEEDMYATQNCYDFCSLLARPIEFMVGVLKETDLQGERSPFRERFVAAIKVRLNQILQIEVVRYASFLESSLKRFDVQQPHPNIDIRKVEGLSTTTEQQLKQNYFTYKEVCRRLGNLIFVKQQLEDIVRDLVEPDVMTRIGDIFGSKTVEAEIPRANRSSQELLLVVAKLTRDILMLEERIIARIARSTVFFFMKKLLERLYYQPKNGRFDELFNGDKPTKLSEQTLMQNKEEIEDYIMLINRNVPAEYLQRFFTYFFRFLALGVKCQLLNPSKFRGIPTESLYGYWNTDMANLASSMKKQCSCTDELLNQNFQQPLRQLIECSRQQSKVLFMRYQQAMLNKNTYECDELLAMMYLRSGDKKAKDFVKKYRPQQQ